MKKQLIFTITLLILLLLFFGCTEMTTKEKNLCAKLASKSYTFIPSCETEKSCFEKVSKIFSTNFDYEEESELYEIQNYVARSWYFYNLSLKEQKDIQKFCKTGEVIKAAKAINQAQESITDSFHELDRAMKKSFDFIKLKETKMSKEKIELLTEEKIYESLIEFRQILSELNSGATNSDTYVSYYSKKAKDFEKSSASKGFPILVEESPFWIKNFDLIKGTLLENLKIEEKNFFPFGEEIAKNAISQAENVFFKKQSLLALQNFPFYEFMKLYSDLGGNSNSALKRFADLVNKTSELEIKLNKTIESKWDLCKNNLDKLTNLLNEEKETEEFKYLADKLMKKTVTADSNIKMKTEEVKKEFIKLKENKYNKTLTKGEELEKLINIETTTNNLLSSLSFKINGFSEKLISECKKDAEEKITFDANTDKEIKKIIEDILYFSSRTKNTDGRECLLNCQEMIVKKELLQKTKQNILLLESKQKDSTKECVYFLEKIFANETLPELKTKFEELKKIQLSKDNLPFFEKQCESIKKQTENELNSEKDYFYIKEQYNKLEKNLETFDKIAAYLNEEKISALNKEYAFRAETFKEYFFNEQLVYEKIAGIKKELFEKITSLNMELDKDILEKTIYYVEKNIAFLKLNSNLVEINKPNQSETRLIINNPFEEINQPIYLQINHTFGIISNKDACVEEVNDKTIKLVYLPKGKTKIDFNEELIVTSLEKDSFIYATNEDSLLKREIFLNPKIELQKVLIKTTTPPNSYNIVALVDSKELVCVNEQGKTTFIIEKINSNSKIELFYKVPKIIVINKELIQTKKNLVDETLIYKIKAQNTFPEKLNATLFITLPSTNAKIDVYSNDYTKKEIKIIEDKIILQNQSFLEKEEKEFELWVTINNSLEYYKEGLEKQESFFKEHDYLDKAETTKTVKEEENLEKMKSLFESNLIEIDKIELNEKKRIDLELMKQKLLEKIEELRQKQKELFELGLKSEAEKIGTTLDLVLEKGLENEKDIANAFDKLVTLVFSSDNKLKSTVEEMWTEVITKSQNIPILLTLKDNFFETKQLFDESFSFDPVKTHKTFLELKEIHNTFLQILKEIDKNNLIQQKILQNKINSDLNYCRNTLNLIEEDLIKNNSDLIKAKFILPLSQSRIDNLRLRLAEIENSSNSFEEKLKLIEPLKDEIWDSMESIKKQAILAFNRAIDNKTSKEILLEGKTLLDQNKYADAYLLLFNTSPSSQILFNFLWFLPILIILITAFILKNKVQFKQNQEKERKEKILEDWEKL